MPTTQWSVKLTRAVRQQPDRLQDGVDDHRLEDVELEMALAAARTSPWSWLPTTWEHTMVMASALGRIDLAGHDR